ncbi:DUF883 family protein [Patescibacteria group bacterium]|nr:DUF883 family protein [Patescibacteria group bacterium]MBP9710089.1 DUF883 family protein [Patescibacteria group bacterium]
MDNKNNSTTNQHSSSTSDISTLATKSQETMNAIKQEGERYIGQAKEQWNDFKEEAQDKGQEVREQVDKATRYADRYARQNPWHVAGIAAAIGAFAALILSGGCRRRRD